MRRSRPVWRGGRRVRPRRRLGILPDSQGALSRCRFRRNRMKTLPKIALALSAFAAVGASAQTFYSGQADQERRERNREEALSAYHSGDRMSTTTSDRHQHATAREE